MADQNIPTSAFTDADGSVYIQQSPGSETHFIGGCFEAGDLPNPQGDVEPIYCLDADRNFQVVAGTKSPPGKITSSVTGLTEGSANWLERFVDDFCPFFIHFVQHTCGTRGVWAHWERVYTYLVQAITDDPISAFMSREGGNTTTHAFNWTAFPPRVGSRRLGIGRKTVDAVQTVAINCIWAEPKMCGSDCGEEIKLGQNLMVGCDNIGATAPHVLRSVDFGDTWIQTGNDPHAASEIAIAGCAFPVDQDTVRNVSVRGIGVTPAAALEIAWTDDAGVTAWNDVTVGGTVGEAVTSGQGIFAFDQEHIWLCTDDGNVFFSDDGALTWVDQNALAASGAGALNSIHFYDANVGVAGGVGPVVIYTIDGGENWVAMTNSSAGVPNSVRMPGPSSLDVISGVAAGDVERTRDRGGSAWAVQYALTEVKSLDIASNTVYFLIDDDGGVDNIYQTADGGLSWQEYTTPTNTGLNHILALSPTLVFAVGEATGGLGTIIKLGQGAS